jgi:hypothetical protein
MDVMADIGKTGAQISGFMSNLFMKLGLGLMVIGVIMIIVGKYEQSKNKDPKTGEEPDSYKKGFGIFFLIIGGLIALISWLKRFGASVIADNKRMSTLAGFDAVSKLIKQI